MPFSFFSFSLSSIGMGFLSGDCGQGSHRPASQSRIENLFMHQACDGGRGSGNYKNKRPKLSFPDSLAGLQASDRLWIMRNADPKDSRGRFSMIKARFEDRNDPITDVERLPDQVGRRFGNAEAPDREGGAFQLGYHLLFCYRQCRCCRGLRERKSLTSLCVLADLTCVADKKDTTLLRPKRD